MAFNSSDDERPIGVRKVYIVEIDHGKPNATRVGGGAWGQVGAESWGGAEFPDSLRKFPAIFYDPKEAQKAADGLAQYLGKRAVAIGKKKNKKNDKVSDGGPLAHESKQDANPPFAAPLG